MATNLPKISVYIEPELKAKLEKLADAEQRSLSKYITLVLQAFVDELENPSDENR